MLKEVLRNARNSPKVHETKVRSSWKLPCSLKPRACSLKRTSYSEQVQVRSGVRSRFA